MWEGRNFSRSIRRGRNRHLGRLRGWFVACCSRPLVEVNRTSTPMIALVGFIWALSRNYFSGLDGCPAWPCLVDTHPVLDWELSISTIRQNFSLREQELQRFKVSFACSPCHAASLTHNMYSIVHTSLYVCMHACLLACLHVCM